MQIKYFEDKYGQQFLKIDKQVFPAHTIKQYKVYEQIIEETKELTIRAIKLWLHLDDDTDFNECEFLLHTYNQFEYVPEIDEEPIRLQNFLNQKINNADLTEPNTFKFTIPKEYREN